ncbi:MAG: amidohydrolase [Pseudomonadota bacterium]
MRGAFAKTVFAMAAFLFAALACSSPEDVPASENAQAEKEVSVTSQLDGPHSLFLGGRIYTGLEDPQTVQAVLVGPDGRIRETGRPDELRGMAPATLREVDIQGATMFPGFVDGHAHLLGIGQRELTLNLSGTGSLDSLVRTVARETRRLDDGQILFGRGWIETDWPEGRMPGVIDLDRVSPDNPVILIRADGHALVANSAAIAAAGIDDDTPNPDGGRIERDAEGAATGIFIDNAMEPLEALVGSPSRAERETALAVGADVYASRGWTGLHNMSVAPRDARLMHGLDEENRLPIRIHNAFSPTTRGLEIAEARRYETDTIQNRAIKIYMDGALGSRGALLFKPYADQPDTSGLALRVREHTVALLQQAAEADIQIAFHAIGDRANAAALDWMIEALGSPEAVKDARWRVEHAQILAEPDIARFGDYGIIASMQPSHAIGDLKFAPDRLGLTRLEGAYAWNSLLQAGAIVVGGSDAPVEVGSPTIEFYAATVRQTIDGQSGEGWHPEEAVTRAEALRMLTWAPAYAAFQENDLGTIQPGKLADFSVFDRDLMRIPGDQILETQPVMTVVGGEIVWRVD